MKKLKRLTKPRDGGGVGHTVASHGPFRVIRWCLSNTSGPYRETELEISTDVRECSLRFDGHHAFKTLADCLTQLTNSEILRLFGDLRESGVEEGKRRKAAEIRHVLGVWNC